MMQGNASPGGTHFSNPDGGVELNLMDVPRSPSRNAQLEFQDIAHTGHTDFRDSASLLRPEEESRSSSSSSSSALPLPSGASQAGGMSDVAMEDDDAPQGDPNASYFSLAYYQVFFDVTTRQLLDRLFRALLPWRGKFYRDDDGSGRGRADRADLYGPFWIATTLIFFLAAAGNFANYIQFINDADKGPGNGNASGKSTDDANGADSGSGSGSGSSDDAGVGSVWNYDFRKVTIGASVFYAWISVVPLCVYCFFKHVGGAGAQAVAASDAGAAAPADHVPQKGLVEIASLFGYGLVWLLPVCLLCIPPVWLLRYISVGVAFAMSSFFLLRNLGAMDIGNKTLLPAIAAILALNFAIALLTKFYFFDF